MGAGEILLLVLLVCFMGSVFSNVIAYWFIKRGAGVLKTIKLTTYVVATLMTIALFFLFLIIASLFGQNIWFAAILIAVIFAVQYLLYPYIFLKSGSIRRPIGDETKLYRMLEDLKRENNITKKIDIYVMDVHLPNAFAVSNFLKRAIVVTKGLLQTLNDEEIKAVLAHELGHIVNRDNSYALATSLIPYIAYIIGLAFVIGGFLLIQAAASSATRSSKEEEQRAGLALGLGGLFFIIIGLIIVIITVIVNVSIMAFSRLREHLADMYSVKSLRNTKLAEALAKIENKIRSLRIPEKQGVLKRAIPSIRRMLYIVPMLHNYDFENISVLRWITIFSTHPPVEARVFIIKRYYRELGSV